METIPPCHHHLQLPPVLHSRMSPQTSLPLQILYPPLQQVTNLNSIITCLSRHLDEIFLSQSQPQPSPPASLPNPSFPCHHCDYSSSTSRGLNSHISKKHKQEVLRENPFVDIGDVSPSVDHRSIPSPSPSIPLDSFSTSSSTLHAISCMECSVTFYNESDLKHHMDTSHAPGISPDKLPFPNKAVPQLPCYDCDNTFNNSHDLGNHLLHNHNLTFPCPHCGIILPEREELIHLHRNWCPSKQCPGSPVCASFCHFDAVAAGDTLF